MTCLTCRDDRGFESVVPGGNRFPEAADHEERVVDSQAQPKHRGQILNQNGQVPSAGPGILQSPEWSRWQAGQRPMESGPPPGFRKPPAEVRGSRESPDFRRVARRRRWLSECRNSVASRPSVRASPPDNGPQLILKRVRPLVKLGDQRLTGPSVDASPTRTKVPPPLPRKIGSRKSRWETTPDTPGSSFSPSTMVANACSPSSESAGGVPESPGPRGQRMANESEWPTPARQFPLRCLRCGLPSPDGARREKKMEEAQGRRQGLPRPARNGAHARDS
jgi:hypothetical protein